MDIEQLNIAAAKALGLTITNENTSLPEIFVMFPNESTPREFDVTFPECMKMVIEHFKININFNDVIEDSWYASVAYSRKIMCYGRDKDRDTAIMKCVEKCLLTIAEENE